MAQIQGKYHLYIALVDASYTLTGADRNADFGFIGDQDELTTRCLNFPDSLNGRIAIPVENRVDIKKIKLVPRGGYGLQNSPLYMAGKFFLQIGRTGDDGFIVYDQVAINIPNWGEWLDVDLSLCGANRIGNDSSFDFLQFSIAYDTAVFTCDDYNLQADFIGQGISPALEMLVETAGVADATNGEIF